MLSEFGLNVRIPAYGTIAPGGSLEVLFSGVQMREVGGEILLYGVTADHIGLQGKIPVGTARVQIPSHS